MSITIDHASLLADVDATLSLGAIEAHLAKHDLTLSRDRAAAPDAMSLVEWLAGGAPGARDPWIDPVDHLVAGAVATLPSGAVLTIRPAPRRAVGPDLIALLTGTRHRFAKITRAWLRVHPIDVVRPTTHPLVVDRDPPINDGEAALLDAIEGALHNL